MNKKCFTLAEVLITLSILGVVAAIMIPNVIKSYEEKMYVTKLKKEYSILENAFNIATIENGPITNWNFKNSSYPTNKLNEQSDIILQKIIPYLNIQRNCSYTDNSCAPENIIYTTLNKDIIWTEPPSNPRYARAILRDGTLVFIFSYGSTCSFDDDGLCGYLRVDLNGVKKPNRVGVDVFDFKITSKKGLIPNGYGDSKKHCNILSDNIYNGTACTYYILRDGKMNYLRKEVQ